MWCCTVGKPGVEEQLISVHHGSVFSPLLFIMVLEALCECRSGCPHELLYADDLVLIAEIMEELIEKFKKLNEDQGINM